MAKYTLDEMSIMAKERKIDSSNLMDIMESLADYNIDNETVRYILEEMVESENIPKKYREWIDEALDSVDLIKGNTTNPELANVVAKQDVSDIIIENAPQITPQVQETIVISTDNSNDTTTTPSSAGTDANGTNGTAELEAAAEQPILPVEPVENDPMMKTEPVIETTPVIETPVVDSLQEDNIVSIKEVYATRPAAYAGAIGKFAQDNEQLMGDFREFCSKNGINVISGEVGEDKGTEICIELNEKSSPYFWNLYKELNDDVMIAMNINPHKIEQTNQEVLTIKIDDKYLSSEEAQRYSNEMLQRVTNVLQSTDKDKDYRAELPPEKWEKAQEFHNDEKEISDKVDLVYSNDNGVNSYFVVADNKEEAKEAAKDMGYTLKEDHGGGVYEIDPNGRKMEGSKFDKKSTNVNYEDSVKGIENGISDLDINYNNKHYQDDNYKKIEEFINENKDPSTMSIIQVYKPDATEDQRIVTLASSNGTRETIAFNNGEEFDNYTLPKIAESYGKDTNVAHENLNDGQAFVNSSNTYLRLNNMPESSIKTVRDKLDNSMSKEEEKVNTNTNAYVKTLSYNNPYNKQAAKVSIAAIGSFIIVTIIGIGLIYLIFGLGV